MIPIPSPRALLHVTLSTSCFLGVAASRRTQNITIEVPYGTTNHGEPNSFCTPATWIDIASYLLLNYVAHGATVVSYPGEQAFDTLLCIVAAILFPTFGVIRALNFIIRHPLLTGKNDLEVAARSGALCMLVRSPTWRPQKGDNIRNALIQDPRYKPSLRGDNTSHSDSNANTLLTAGLSFYRPPWLNDRTRFWSYTDTNLSGIGSRAVFGLSEPPDQYEFAFVPRNTVVLALVDSFPTPPSNIPDEHLLRRIFASQVSMALVDSFPTPPSNIPDKHLLRRIFASQVSMALVDSSPTPSSNVSDKPLLRRIFASPISTPKLSSSSNIVKGMVALLQLLYTSFTLYHTNGDQLNQFGFAAPGLTVLPYAIMSGLNLLASLVAPNYPTMYLVRSKVMEEAERRTGLRFHYAVGRVVDELDTDTDVMEGWSEIAGSFEDNDKVLYVTTPAGEGEKIEIHNMFRQRIGIGSEKAIYVPSCPRFRRTDDPETSPLRRFYKNLMEGLVFPRYLARRRNPLSFSFSQLSSLPQSRERAPVLPPSLIYFVGLPDFPLNKYETCLVAFIFGAEFLITLALSKFRGQQSTTAQRGWTVAWLFAGYVFGAGIYTVNLVLAYLRRNSRILGMLGLRVRSRRVVCVYIAVCSAPAIGGFVVVSQMLRAYGICYKFV